MPRQVASAFFIFNKVPTVVHRSNIMLAKALAHKPTRYVADDLDGSMESRSYVKVNRKPKTLSCG